MPAGTVRTIQVTGVAGVPDDGTVGAVAIVATALAPATEGQLVRAPDSDTTPTIMLSYGSGATTTISNSSVLAVADDGTIQVTAPTSINLTLDVQGFYTASDSGTAAGGFVANPVRIADTRSGVGVTKGALAPGATAVMQVGGSNGIPADASGIVANFIVINTSNKSGYITPYATGAVQPTTSLTYQSGSSVGRSPWVATTTLREFYEVGKNGTSAREAGRFRSEQLIALRRRAASEEFAISVQNLQASRRFRTPTQIR